LIYLVSADLKFASRAVFGDSCLARMRMTNKRHMFVLAATVHLIIITNLTCEVQGLNGCEISPNKTIIFGRKWWSRPDFCIMCKCTRKEGLSCRYYKGGRKKCRYGCLHGPVIYNVGSEISRNEKRVCECTTGRVIKCYERGQFDWIKWAPWSECANCKTHPSNRKV
ncbi:unnamed protein product, partial [Owenia fusiformis]